MHTRELVAGGVPRRHGRHLVAAALALAALLACLPAQAAFTDNGDGTVTDTVTGLMWDRCPYGQTGSDCSGGAQLLRSWPQALALTVALNAANWKGHNDWRLPNVKELESLVKIDGTPIAIDTTAFPNTDCCTWFWSSTLLPSGSVFLGTAWAVYFYDGRIDALDSTLTANNSLVRVVRSGQSADAYDLLAPPAASAGPAPRAADATAAPAPGSAASAAAPAALAAAAPTAVRTITGSTATGSGIASVTMATSDGGPACGFAGSGFVAVESTGVAPPAGLRFPHGLADLHIANCTAAGSTVSVTLRYPQPLPAGTRWWKFGPPQKGAAPAWYPLPGAVVAGDTVTLTLTDGALGDDDWTVNGSIADPGGPAVAAAAVDPPPVANPIPVLDGWALRGLLALLVAGIAAARGLRRSRGR